MKLYTKQGDTGKTALIYETNIDKHSSRIECIGSIDELSAALGLVYSSTNDIEIRSVIKMIQNVLFSMGGGLADGKSEIRDKNIEFLENILDKYDSKLPKLKNFILPIGCRTATALHLARTICRRAERRLSFLRLSEGVDKAVFSYINRLSDLLFVLARLVNHRANFKEVIWHNDTANKR